MTTSPKRALHLASRAVTGPGATPVFERPGAPMPRTHAPQRGGAIDDAAIRREFETLAARIRTLQERAAREAASLLAAR